MHKVLAVLGAAVVPVLLLSGCNSANGPAGTSSLPNAFSPAAHVRPHDTTNDLEAGGATFPAYAYNLASEPVGSSSASRAQAGTGSLFASVKFSSGGHIYYCLTGSGTGVGIFTTGSKAQTGAGPATTTGPCAPLGAIPTGFGARVDPPDFAGSDVALASSDYTAYASDRKAKYGEPLELPVIGGPIVFAYTAAAGFPNVSRIHLSQWSYCAISNGTITNWNDTAITKDNGGVSVTGGVSRPITFYFRADGSGTSYNFTYHLNAVCHGAWPAPYNAKPYEYSGHSATWTWAPNKTWPGPGSAAVPNPHFIGETGNPGVLAAIQGNSYSTGYVEGAYAASATSPTVSQAILATGNSKAYGWGDPTVALDTKNAFSKVTASAITYGGGSDGNPLGTSRPECVLYISPANFTNPVALGDPNNSYPIMAVSYLMFYQHQPAVFGHFSQKSTLINYMYGTAARNIESNFEYTPLALGIVNAGLAAKNGSGSVAPCLQS